MTIVKDVLDRVLSTPLLKEEDEECDEEPLEVSLSEEGLLPVDPSSGFLLFVVSSLDFSYL